MQILFKSRHPEAALMRDTVERRVRFALVAIERPGAQGRCAVG